MLIPISVQSDYLNIINLRLIVNEYIDSIAIATPLLILGAVLIYRYAPSLSRVILSDVVRVYNSRGILDVFTRKRLIQLYFILLIPALISYLVNAGIIRVVGPNHVILTAYPLMGLFNYMIVTIGIINLVLSTWLIIGVSYLQLRIAARRLISRIGGVISGTVGIAASTGTATFVSSACGLGVCTAPVYGVSPMAMVVMGMFDVNAFELTHYSLIALLILTLITSVLLVIVHRIIIKG
ncbi:hypothetical protein [Vulcanisaeta sp. JCM 14467]|uniref:hypothetical protein n=1 Tax=Vulcanisaeta sp. JCM 14467 TaxID=1295370 RepID=UPI002092501E|nr:hypothetical protein [Vulcanisaeta sp. JCM 14467]